MARPNGSTAIPSISGALDMQDTIISHHSHMQKDRSGGMSYSMYPIDSAAQGTSREPKPGAEDNVQPRFELFLLADGEKKVTEEPDTREFLPLTPRITAQNGISPLRVTLGGALESEPI